MSQTFTSTTTCDKCGKTETDPDNWPGITAQNYADIYKSWDLCPSCWTVLQGWFK